ncbi:hypothetical protein ACWCXB_26760 [Streptomyces sp. NPDC001514]
MSDMRLRRGARRRRDGHVATGPPRRGGWQFVAYDNGVGGLQSEVRAGAAHRDRAVRRGRRGCVVDAVADDQHPLPRRIEYSLYDNHVAQLLDEAVYHTEHLRLGARDLPARAGDTGQS